MTKLEKASLIYETPTEGGITRFLSIYVENDVEKIGPVRSARTYFLDWLSEFDGIFGHCGGNADALDLIRPYDIKDLDEFFELNPKLKGKIPVEKREGIDSSNPDALKRELAERKRLKEKYSKKKKKK